MRYVFNRTLYMMTMTLAMLMMSYHNKTSHLTHDSISMYNFIES